MTTQEAQAILERVWKEAQERGREMKDPFLPIEAIHRRVANSSGADRVAFERVITSWLDTKDGNRFYGALSLVRRLEITSALPRMNRLRRKLRLMPWRIDDFEMLQNTLRRMEVKSSLDDER